MNAFRCDLCGDLFVHRGEMRIKSLAGIYYTLIRNNAGAIIDICDSCRLQLQDVFDNIGDNRELEEKGGAI